MAYDLQEQEQIDSLKAWWRSNGNRIMSAVTLALLGVLAYQGWSMYQLRRAAAAAVLYEEFERVAASKDAKDVAKARDLAGSLIDQHGSTVYAAMAALREAKANADAGDPKTARAQLTWAAEHARPKELALVARVRLAGLLLDEKSYEAALEALNVTIPDAFASQFADRRGDVYAAQGKTPQARAAYSEALAKGAAQSRALIQMKLDALPSA